MSRTTILDHYIAKTVLSAIALITLVLTGLQIFMLFFNEINSIGKGGFGIIQCTVFVLLQTPYHVYLFFPIISLLGCLIGLGVLASHSELTIMRAAGMSIGQITMAIVRISCVLIFVVTLFGELVAPTLIQYANDYKTAAVSGGQALRTARGVWLRHENDFIFVGQVLPSKVLDQVVQFHFDAHHHLINARNIREARFVDNAWMLYDVQQTDFSSHGTHINKFSSLPWELSIKPNILMSSSIHPDEMTLRELNRYLRAQKHSKQNVQNYRLALFQRLTQPFSTIVMMILAIPFVFGPLRSTTMGAKILIGATVGFGFHIMNHFFGSASLVFQWPPLVAAVGPTIIFAIIGIYLMQRAR